MKSKPTINFRYAPIEYLASSKKHKDGSEKEVMLLEQGNNKRIIEHRHHRLKLVPFNPKEHMLFLSKREEMLFRVKKLEKYVLGVMKIDKVLSLIFQYSDEELSEKLVEAQAKLQCTDNLNEAEEFQQEISALEEALYDEVYAGIREHKKEKIGQSSLEDHEVIDEYGEGFIEKLDKFFELLCKDTLTPEEELEIGKVFKTFENDFPNVDESSATILKSILNTISKGIADFENQPPRSPQPLRSPQKILGDELNDLKPHEIGSIVRDMMGDNHSFLDNKGEPISVLDFFISEGSENKPSEKRKKIKEIRDRFTDSSYSGKQTDGKEIVTKEEKQDAFDRALVNGKYFSLSSLEKKLKHTYRELLNPYKSDTIIHLNYATCDWIKERTIQKGVLEALLYEYDETRQKKARWCCFSLGWYTLGLEGSQTVKNLKKLFNENTTGEIKLSEVQKAIHRRMPNLKELRGSATNTLLVALEKEFGRSLKERQKKNDNVIRALKDLNESLAMDKNTFLSILSKFNKNRNAGISFWSRENKPSETIVALKEMTNKDEFEISLKSIVNVLDEKPPKDKETKLIINRVRLEFKKIEAVEAKKKSEEKMAAAKVEAAKKLKKKRDESSKTPSLDNSIPSPSSSLSSISSGI